MKKWVHAACYPDGSMRGTDKKRSIPKMAQKISDARKELEAYTDEQIEYVQRCQDEIASAISERYAREEEGLDPMGPDLSEIKRDYMVGAIEDDLLTEEEFDNIFDLLDVIGLELSAPFA